MGETPNYVYLKNYKLCDGHVQLYNNHLYSPGAAKVQSWSTMDTQSVCNTVAATLVLTLLEFAQMEWTPA